MNVEQAKEVLRKKGYFVDNLWNVSDVKQRYVCDEDTAQDILYKSLTNDATMEQIWLSIDIFSEDLNLTKKVSIMTNQDQKILVDNSTYMEFIDDIATKITIKKFGDDAYAPSSEVGKEDVMMLTEDAQDFYNEQYDWVESLLHNAFEFTQIKVK